jgi:hypothetical protein
MTVAGDSPIFPDVARAMVPGRSEGYQMTNSPKLSARARTALQVLRNGGEFRYALEQNSYTGIRQFRWRLLTARGSRVPGVAGATFQELEREGIEFRTRYNGFSGESTSYLLATE